MQSPVLPSLQSHQGTPTILKGRKCSILDSPISSVIKNKKKFFKAVKFNEEVIEVKDDYGKDDFNNNNDDCFKSYNVKKLLGDFENSQIDDKEICEVDSTVGNDSCHKKTTGGKTYPKEKITGSQTYPKQKIVIGYDCQKEEINVNKGSCKEKSTVQKDSYKKKIAVEKDFAKKNLTIETDSSYKKITVEKDSSKEKLSIEKDFWKEEDKENITPPKPKTSLEFTPESPLAPGNMQFREKNDMTGSEVEKVLLERLLMRKDLKLANMQQRIQEIQTQMDLIKDNNNKSLKTEAEEKVNEIDRLQAENESLRNLPGIDLLQFLLYLCVLIKSILSMPAKVAHGVISVLFSPLALFVGFYKWIFYSSANLAETGCYFIEYSAIKLRMRIGNHMKPAVKTPLSPPPVKEKPTKALLKTSTATNNNNKGGKNNLTKRKRKSNKK